MGKIAHMFRQLFITQFCVTEGHVDMKDSSRFFYLHRLMCVSLPPGKTLPVHCVVEAVSSLEENTWRRRALVESDSYVIIPAATAFHELVPAALMRLGYPHELTASAKGT